MTIADSVDAHRGRLASLTLVEAPCFMVAGERGSRLLAGPTSSVGFESLTSHVTRLGELDLSTFEQRDLRRMVRASGLLGRGGAGFPTATKFDVAAESPGSPIVVVNASEGEPASRKDQTLLELRPHLVIDGAQLAAAAVGANDIIVYTHLAHAAANESLRAALAERGDLPVAMRVVNAPATYIAGETSAVVSYLDGRGALPSRGVIPAARSGIARRPTIVNNIETLSHLALIARHGAEWFCQAGTVDVPGSTLLTLAGAVSEPGRVVEVVGRATFGEILGSYGGLTGPPRAVLLGGYEGTWMPGEAAWHTPIDRHLLSKLGMSLGCGVVAVLDEDKCGLSQTARLVTWLASQSAGQCGPCIFGLPTLSEELQRLVTGRSRRGDVRRLRELTSSVRGRGACGHPTGVASLVESALDTFTPELRSHLRGEVCHVTHDGRDFPLPQEEGRR